MKRFLVLFALALAMLLPAAAKADLFTFQLSQELLDFIAGAPPADDLAAGEGKFAPTAKGESTQFTVSAHGPGGLGGFFRLPEAAAKGNVRIKINGVEEHGRVECMLVSRNAAFIEGSFDEPIKFEGQSFPDFFIQVTDNGEPNNQDQPDSAGVALDLVSTPCHASTLSLAGGDIQQGNIVVMDRP